MQMKHLLLQTLALVTLSIAVPSFGFAADAVNMPPPRIVQTHSNIFGAVIFWDATPYIERFVAQDASEKDALKQLEVQGLRIFVAHAPELVKMERHLRVVAAFSRSGPISARYQTSTLEGIQTIFTLDGNLRANMQFPRDWETNAQRGVLPPGIRLQVVNASLKK